MTSDRKTALVAGVFFLITFIHIPAVLLYDPILNSAHYIVGGGSDTRVFFGAFLEIIVAIANIGTAVVLFPILKRESESISLGYVASRILESTVILAGTVSLLAIVTLRQDLAGGATDHGSLILTGRTLIAFHKATFLIGPAFCSASTGILLGTLMYRSGLVPRAMVGVGIVGGCLAFVAATLPLFNAFDQGSAGSFLLTAPEIVWEVFLGIYLTFWGFRPSPILSDPPTLVAAR